ncbi:hypothetical protein SNEBB_008822 [Seison nebaliae]|nr:hypothetical protein SNEBB_008822 [Seison nebaliae]
MFISSIKSIILNIFLIITIFVQKFNFQFGELDFIGLTIKCWHCDAKEAECRRNFDFTEHSYQICDGKCWKSYEILKITKKEDIIKATQTPVNRRCFTSEELIKANSLGLDTSNGCRKNNIDSLFY